MKRYWSITSLFLWFHFWFSTGEDFLCTSWIFCPSNKNSPSEKLEVLQQVFQVRRGAIHDVQGEKPACFNCPCVQTKPIGKRIDAFMVLIFVIFA